MNDLGTANIDRILYISDVDEKLQLFNSILLDLFNKHAPITTSRISKKSSSWRNFINTAIKNEEKAYVLYKINTSNSKSL